MKVVECRLDAAVARFGGVDMLVLNAGIFPSSQSIQDIAAETWRSAMSVNVEANLLVMQRCHERDLSGHVLEQGGWDYLCLAAVYEISRPVTSIGWADPRTQSGELLWPERFGVKEIEDLKRSLGSYGAAGQLQQRPAPAGGS